MTETKPQNCVFRSHCGWVVLTVFVWLTGCSQKIDTPAEFREAAYLHESRGEFAKAVENYKRAIELDKNVATIWYDMGVAYASMEKLDDAIAAYTEAIRLDENLERAFNNRAAAYAQKDMLKEAIADCDSAIKLDPTDELAWRNRGLANHDLGNLNRAILDYDESVRRDGRNALTYLYRGNAYLESKAYVRALEDFNHALSLDSNLAAAWLSQAKAYNGLGNPLKAEESAARAKELGADITELADASSEVPAPPNVHEAAVAFVRQKLTLEKAKITRAFRPWHFDADDDNGPQHVLVAVANGQGIADLSFNQIGLETLKSSKIPTTLFLVQPVAGPAPDTATPAEFRILQHTTQWRPSESSLQPVMWNMSIGGAPDETVTER